MLVGVCTLTLWIGTVDSTSSAIDDNMSEEEKMQMQCRTVQHAVGRLHVLYCQHNDDRHRLGKQIKLSCKNSVTRQD